ncbi:EcsC family protein [Leekyejoonella antrihumi]|uniref:EcsC family protein n=1 Tax=Leekyejoonella antrihumi TaxID=1660198 RepID=A0A563DYX6_9MICO|nr:EcsC family protein [Leekyejoonella antrihumi]TWP35201.1 hypothetical protein FGL98_14840 [Leekyejoonella antrihumi]
MLGRKKETNGKSPARLEDGPFAGSAHAVAQRLLDVGLDGGAGFSSAQQIADDALRAHPMPEEAIDAIVTAHRKLAAVGGFVTGLGGFVTMPAALPANVLEFYLVATRMVGAIAAVRGYQLSNPSLRTAVLLTLVDADAGAVMQKAGVVSTGRLASLASQRLPAPALMVVNKAVGFRLVGQVSGRMLPNLGRGVPLAGGVVGAGLDAYLLNKIGKDARREFPPRT